MSTLAEELNPPSVGSDLQLSTVATFGSTIVGTDQQLSTVATFGSKTTIMENGINKPLRSHSYAKETLLSDQDTEYSSGSEESDAFDDDDDSSQSSSTSSSDDDDDDEDDETSSYYSNASTLTSMPSLAVIPKGRMARYAPPQFHSLSGSSHQNHENPLNRQQQEPTKSSSKMNKVTSKSQSSPMSLYSSRSATKSRHVPPVSVAPLTTTKSSVVAPVSPTQVRSAPLPPLVRPAVAIRRNPLRPTIGGGSATVNTINHRSWWEMPLDSLLGYPSLPSSTRVWDPMMYEEKEKEGTDDEYDDDVRFFHKTREEGSI
eukprot:scaffold28034_cov183-Amphora_coffeaeformis.AAC.1